MIGYILVYIIVVALLKYASNVFKGLGSLLIVLALPFYIVSLLIKGTPKQRKDVIQILSFLFVLTAVVVFLKSVSP